MKTSGSTLAGTVTPAQQDEKSKYRTRIGDLGKLHYFSAWMKPSTFEKEKKRKKEKEKSTTLVLLLFLISPFLYFCTL